MGRVHEDRGDWGRRGRTEGEECPEVQNVRFENGVFRENGIEGRTYKGRRKHQRGLWITAGIQILYLGDS